jgi:hypothetical protein
LLNVKLVGALHNQKVNTRHLIVFTVQDQDTNNQVQHNLLLIKQLALFPVLANAVLKYLYWCSLDSSEV